MNAHALQYFGAMAFAGTVVMGIRILLPSPARLAGRLRPYTTVSRSALGRAPDVGSIVIASRTAPKNALERLLQPLAESLARATTGFLGQRNQQQLALRLRQAGIGIDIPDEQRVHDYRVRQLSKVVLFGSLGAAVSIVQALSPAGGMLLILAGALLGASREPTRLSATLNDRTQRMRIELYTVNQQLAMHLRTGGSSIQAVQRICKRGHGEVISELREALRQHERGMTASKAFQRIADNTPEAYAARTYKMLAAGAERGSDLAEGLLSLSDDVREGRRESLKRAATRRRGLMLMPTVGVMAPILIIFIAAPLPSIVFGIRH